MMRIERSIARERREARLELGLIPVEKSTTIWVSG